MQREFSPNEGIEDEPEEECSISEALRHREECPHEDCLCRNPSGKPAPGDIVYAGSEPGIILGRARDGMITVKWGEYWQQGYPIDHFIIVGDHWEVGQGVK